MKRRLDFFGRVTRSGVVLLLACLLIAAFEAGAAPKKKPVRAKKVVAAAPTKKRTPTTRPKSAAPGEESGTRKLEALLASDPQVKNLDQWEALLTLLKKSASKSGGAQSLYDLGRAHEQIARSRNVLRHATFAVSAYERVARTFEGNTLSDDALLRLGDLRKDRFQDDVGARAAYYEIVDRYQRSNSATSAQDRIDELDGKAPTKFSQIEKRERTTALKSNAALGVSKSPVSETTPSPKKVEPEQVIPAVAQPFAPLPAAVSVEPPAEDEIGIVGDPSRGKQLLSGESPIRRPLVVIDAGHGGEDLGAKGLDGALEKEVVLQISLYLDQLIRERLRARTVLTRSTDVFIPLADRTRIANDKNADLFISIHANASEYKTASGVETYYLDNTNDKSSLRLAERENTSLEFGKGGGKDIDVSFMLSDLIQSAKLDDSISLAHELQQSLYTTLARYYHEVDNLGVKKAPFYVLVGAHMPCVLVEVSFIDHPLEGRRLTDKRYQRLIALSLYQGVRKFFVARPQTSR